MSSLQKLLEQVHSPSGDKASSDDSSNGSHVADISLRIPRHSTMKPRLLARLSENSVREEPSGFSENSEDLDAAPRDSKQLEHLLSLPSRFWEDMTAVVSLNDILTVAGQTHHIEAGLPKPSYAIPSFLKEFALSTTLSPDNVERVCIHINRFAESASLLDVRFSMSLRDTFPTASLRAFLCPDRADDEQNYFTYLLSLMTSRVSVAQMGNTWNAKMLFREAASTHMMNEVLTHAIQREQALSAALSCKDSYQDTHVKCNGFTRPGVLILVPTRHDAWRIVSLLLNNVSRSCALSGLSRWEAQYAPDVDQDHLSIGGSNEEGISVLPDEVPDEMMSLFCGEANLRKHLTFRRQFLGSMDDDFTLGIRLHITLPVNEEESCANGEGICCTIKLMAPEKSSDIIIASPLGLRQYCNIDPTTDNTFKARIAKGADDFKLVNDIAMLSSIHTLFIDSTDYLEQQNWEHVLSCLWALNRTPKDANLAYEKRFLCEINTYLPTFIEQRQEFTCQVLMHGLFFSELSAGLLALSEKYLSHIMDYTSPIPDNHSFAIDAADLSNLEPGRKRGTSRIVAPIDMSEAFEHVSLLKNRNGFIRLSGIPFKTPLEMLQLLMQNKNHRIILHRLDRGVVKTRLTDILGFESIGFDVRQFHKVDYFVNTLLPMLVKNPEQDKGLLFMVPDYFFYLRAVHCIKRLSQFSDHWAGILETSDVPDINRAKQHLKDGRISFILMTERSFFYHRTNLTSCRSIVYLSPPADPSVLELMSSYFDKDNSVRKTTMLVFEPPADTARLFGCAPANMCHNILKGKSSMVLSDNI